MSEQARKGHFNEIFVRASRLVRTVHHIPDCAVDVLDLDLGKLATRAALASEVDLSEELGFPHSNAVVREFLAAVEKRLSKELGE